MSSIDDQGFREQLADRIRRYGEQRDRVQKQLLELNHTLLTTQQRLDTASEMYRLEFDEEPPFTDATKTLTTLPIGSAETVKGKSRRVRSGGPSWKETVVGVLREAGEPLHLNEMWDRMHAAGFETESKDPRRSLASILVRHAGVVRTGRNTYGLVEWSEHAAVEGPQLGISQAVPEPQAPRDQEAIAWST